MLDSLILRLPDEAQYQVPGQYTQPDFYYREGGVYYVATYNTVSGFWSEYNARDAAYNNKIAAGLGTGSFVEVTKSHFGALRTSCAAVRAGKG